MLKTFQRLFFLLVALMLGYKPSAQRPIKLIVRQSTNNHKGEKLFVAGSFNGWAPGVTQLNYDALNNVYATTIQLQAKETMEFKFTRGSWDKVEVDAKGGEISNRVVSQDVNGEVMLEVQAWKDDFAATEKKSTATKNVVVLEEVFMPQLGRRRVLRLYLPNDYSNSTKRYKVLYMHDGQNLFDELTAPYGEWKIDETLSSLANDKQCIVVGIDNGEKRLTEYNPYNNKRFGNGEGNRYVDFIANTLKPYIDKHYRTLPEKQNTAIAGSSMGGLISMYAILKHPNVFGAAGVFSPSFWIAPKMMKLIKSKGKNFRGRIYLYAGGMESAALVPDAKRAERYLKSYTSSSVKLSIDNNGKHNESAWSHAFPMFYDWWF